MFYRKDLGAAFGTGLIDWLIPQGEATLGILITTVESPPLFGCPLHQFAWAILLRTWNIRTEGFGVFAARIVVAGQEFLAGTALSDNHHTPAFLA